MKLTNTMTCEHLKNSKKCILGQGVNQSELKTSKVLFRLFRTRSLKVINLD